MKTTKKLFSLSIFVCMCFGIFLSCSERERSNPLDPQGAATGEDLFSLIAAPGPNKIHLTWSKYDFDDFELFKIYRTDSTDTFGVVSQQTTTTYIDTFTTGYDTIFQYKISMVVGGVESETSKIVKATPLDGIPPVVTLIAPQEGSAVSGIYEVETTGEDNFRFHYMQFYIDNVFVGADSTAPYSYIWDTTKLEESSDHQIKMTGWDYGRNSVSFSRSVKVMNIPPEVISVSVDDEDEIVKSGELTFTITFSNGMDTSVDPSVTFGLSTPYDKNSILGTWNENAKVWVGKFYIDDSVGDGLNLVSIKDAVSKSGLSSKEHSSFDFVVDTAKPSPSSVIIQDDTKAVNKSSVKLTLETIDSGGSVKDMMVANGSDFTGAAWMPYSETHDWNLASGDGNKKVYAKFRDVAGNVSDTVSDQIIVDITSPSILIDSPQDEAIIFEVVPIVVTADDNTDLSKIELYIDDNKVSSSTTSPLEFDWDTADYEDKDYVISFQSFDIAGNVSEKKSITVTVEKSRPRVASITLDDSSPVDAGLLSFTIAFEVEMDTKVNPVVTFGLSSPYDNHNITGTWKDQTTWAGSYVIDETTGDGDNIIKVSGAASSFGLAMDDDMSHSFVIDTVSPEMTAFTVENDVLYVSSTSVSVSVTADDSGSGVAEVIIDNDASLSGGTWIPHEGSVNYDVTSGDGTKTLYGKVRDEAGNESSLVSDSITLDTLAPAIQITNPAQGSTLSGAILVAADISDLNGINNVTLFIDGNEVKSYTQAPYEYDFDTTPFADGSEHTIKFSAQDGAYNTSETEEISVTTDQSLTTVKVFSLSDPSPTKSGTHSLTIEFSSVMDRNSAPVVTYGREHPYSEYAVSGSWSDETTWAGDVVITEGTTNGTYLFSVTDAKNSIGATMRVYRSGDVIFDTVPPQSASVKVNDGNIYTISYEVSLSLSALDPTSGMSDVMFANESLFSGSGWEPFSETKTWTLTDNEGSKTVYVKFRDAAGNESSVVTDDIIVNLTPPLAVTFEQAKTEEDGVHMSWSQNADNDFSYYEVMRSSSSGVTTSSTLISKTSDRTSTTLVDNAVESETTYYYRVFTYDVAGLYSGSNELEVTIEAERSIRGVVTDRSTSSSLSGVTVSINPEIQSSLVTNSSGEYSFDGIADVGDYVLTFAKSGFISLSTNVMLDGSGVFEKNVSLLNLPEVEDLVSPGVVSLSNPQHIALSADGMRGYVTDSSLGIVGVIDTSDNSFITSVEVGDGPIGVATSPVFNQVFVASSISNTVSVIDGTSNQEIKRIDVGNYPVAVAVTPDGQYVLVTNRMDNTVAVIETESFTVVTAIDVGSDPEGIAINPNGTEAYVANSDANTVSVIDLSSTSVVKTIFVSSGPSPIAVSSDGLTVYVVNRFANSVSVIDTGTRKVVDTVAVGDYPTNIAIAPDGEYEGFIYVLNYSDSNMSLIDSSTLKVNEETVSLGNYPMGIAVTPDGGKIFVVNDVNMNVMVVEY